VKEARLADSKMRAGYKLSAEAFPKFRHAFEKRFLQRLVPFSADEMLKRVQQFDPPGIAARDLRECLMIQLNQLDRPGAAVPWLAQACHVVAEHLDVLAAHDLTALKRKTRLEDEDLRAVLQLIQSMNPRPGHDRESGNGIHRPTPVRRERDKWLVERIPERAASPHQLTLRKHGAARRFGRHEYVSAGQLAGGTLVPKEPTQLQRNA
jgi:DNA-directed RNA polymerase specialized sigma54-like protein